MTMKHHEIITSVVCRRRGDDTFSRSLRTYSLEVYDEALVEAGIDPSLADFGNTLVFLADAGSDGSLETDQAELVAIEPREV